MQDNTTQTPGIEIPEELQDKAKTLVADAFLLLASQAKTLAESLENFRTHQKQVHEGIQRGARRTSGRIV